MATFLGYTTEELKCEGNEQRQIEHILNIFRMPECGARSTRFLHDSLRKAKAQSTYGMYVVMFYVSDLVNH